MRTGEREREGKKLKRGVRRRRKNERAKEREE